VATTTANNNPVAALGDVTRFADLRKRLFFLIGSLIVYRIGSFIPVPGIDPVALARFFTDNKDTLLSMFNMFSGGAMERLTIFALGVMPYITASIIVQMASQVDPVHALRHGDPCRVSRRWRHDRSANSRYGD
jgi:preprotein translocase subunit SecY